MTLGVSHHEPLWVFPVHSTLTGWSSEETTPRTKKKRKKKRKRTKNKNPENLRKGSSVLCLGKIRYGPKCLWTLFSRITRSSSLSFCNKMKVNIYLDYWYFEGSHNSSFKNYDLFEKKWFIKNIFDARKLCHFSYLFLSLPSTCPPIIPYDLKRPSGCLSSTKQSKTTQEHVYYWCPSVILWLCFAITTDPQGNIS